MNKLIFTFALFSTLQSFSQTITIEFPAFAGKTYDFTIFQGDKRITLKQDTIPKGGKVQLTIPESHKGYKGMAQWYLTNSATGGGLDLIINNENFSVTCLDSIPTSENIIYKNTPENLFDKGNYKKQQDLFQKHDAMLATKRAYPPKSSFYKRAAKEYNSIINQYAAYVNSLKQSHLYAAKFRQIVNLTMGIGTIITQDEKEKANNINDFITNKLDFAILYTSNHWGGIIQSWVQLQTKIYNNKESFVNDFKTISNRIPNPTLYTDFVGKVTYYLTQEGKDDFISAIAPAVISSGKITSYEGKTMQVYVTAMIGSQAPDLVITEHIGKPEDHNHKTTVLKSNELATGDYEQTLLVFYQSGCGPCEALMATLPQQYENLKQQDIRLITISADKEEAVFKNSSSSHPWQDKYCDYEGFGGVNFKNYAVQGTPTLVLLDKAGKILKRGARLNDVVDLQVLPKPFDYTQDKKELKIGQTAPDINFSQYTYFPQGMTAKKLSEVNANQYLVVFAAGWCPHCTTELPKVAEAYPDLKAKGIEVVLVSLDETTTDFAQFAAPFPFISTTDLQKWDGQAAKDYQVYATPSYFMLDKDLKIVGKYSSLEAVLR